MKNALATPKISLKLSYALKTYAKEGVNIINLNSSYKIKGKSVKAI